MATDTFSLTDNSYFWPSDAYETLREVTFSWSSARILLGVYGNFTVDIGATADSSGSSTSYGKMDLVWFYPNGQEYFDSPFWYAHTVYHYFKKKEDYSLSVSSVTYDIAGKNIDGYQVNFDMDGTVEALTDLKYRHYEISTLPSNVFVYSEYGKSMKIKKAKLYTDIATPTDGIIRFRVYWDGSNVTLGSFGNITSGILYVGGVSTGLSLTQNAWHTIVIAWGDTEQDYVYIDSTDNIFQGSFTVDTSYFGSSDDTNTLIDDVEVYNYYVTPEQAQYVEEGIYAIKVNGTTYTIYPEGSDQLGTISVTFFDANGTVLGSDELSESSPLLIAPGNTTKISLSRENVERVYSLQGISSTSLAFPGTGELAVKVITAYIYPATYDTLEIKTLDGKVVFRDNITDMASFTALYGAYYVFTVEGSQGTFSVIAQATDNLALNFPDPDEAFSVSEEYERLIANKQDNDIVITYVGNSTVNGTITIIGRDKSGKIVQNVSLAFAGSAYNARFPASSNIAYYVISVETSSGFKASKVVATSLSMKFLVIDKIFPPGIRLMFFGFLGLFLVGRKHKELSPLLAFMVLSIMALLEWVIVPVFLEAQLGVLAALELFFKAKEEGWMQ
ncbi:MAG: hypothetical protein ACTSPB_19860 [Candidatus Thorarchaeota archaeon]